MGVSADGAESSVGCCVWRVYFSIGGCRYTISRHSSYRVHNLETMFELNKGPTGLFPEQTSLEDAVKSVAEPPFFQYFGKKPTTLPFPGT